MQVTKGQHLNGVMKKQREMRAFWSTVKDLGRTKKIKIKMCKQILAFHAL